MSQTALPLARDFDGWSRLPVSKNWTSLTTSMDTERELWSTLEYYSEVEEAGLELIQTKGLQPQEDPQKIYKDFQAFVRQAKSYYDSAKTLHYRSNSLLYYYSFLNLVKAYLLLRNPQRIMGRTTQAVTHGLSYRPSTANTDFRLESIRVSPGIFPMYYEAQTANVISTDRSSSLNIINLMSYPCEINYEYQLAGYGDGRVLPSLAAVVIDRTVNHQSWTLLCIPASNNLSDFLSVHTNFLNSFEEVGITDHSRTSSIYGMSPFELTYCRFFEDKIPLSLSNGLVMQHIHVVQVINAMSPYLSFHYYDDNKDFDLALPYQDAARPAPLPINEAIAIFAVMFYLSSLVRYRPSYLEALLNKKPAWLIENFVKSTPQTFLRVMVSKIIEIDYIFRRR
jgi:hypothetical protein